MLVDGLNEACQPYGLKINIEKTNVTGVTERSEPLTVGISIGGIILRKINCFKFLGSLLDEDARIACDIRARIGMARATFGHLYWSVLMKVLNQTDNELGSKTML